MACATIWSSGVCMDYSIFGRANIGCVLHDIISHIVENYKGVRESFSMQLTIHTDGGARGNPGPAAVGVVIEGVIKDANDEKNVVIEFGKKIGETTNNVAEYTAVIEALGAVKTLMSDEGGVTESDITINFLLDSTLVVNQINGTFKVKEPRLRQLLLEVHSLEVEVGGLITYSYVPRAQNARADYFVNQALDAS